MGTYTYPPFPTLGSSPSTFLLQLFKWILEVPLVAIANFLRGVAGATTSGSESSVAAITGFIGTTWANSVSSFQSLGVLAPIIASLIWGAGILILIFFVFKAVQLGMRETEED